MPREARSSARAGPTPFKYLTSEESVSFEAGIVFSVFHFGNVTRSRRRCGNVGIRRLVFGRIPKRGGKRGKLVLAFGVFHAFLGASFPQRVACRFFSNRNSTARDHPAAPGLVSAPLAGRGRPGPARWLGDVAP